MLGTNEAGPGHPVRGLHQHQDGRQLSVHVQQPRKFSQTVRDKMRHIVSKEKKVKEEFASRQGTLKKRPFNADFWQAQNQFVEACLIVFIVLILPEIYKNIVRERNILN